jgi:signal transduction histidine kinase
MRLLPKLTLGILVAATVPLAIAGIFSTRDAERALRQKIRADQAAIASGAAHSVGRFWRETLSSLGVFPDLLDLERAAPDVLTGALRIAYRSGEGWAQVALVDREHRPIVPLVAADDAETAAALGGRPVVSAAEKEDFLARAPVEAALARGSAIGEVVPAGDPPRRRAAVALAIGGRVLVADVGLGALERELAELSRGGQTVALVAVADRPSPDADGVLVGPGGERLYASVADVPGTPFVVQVTQPELEAFAPVFELRRRTLYWLVVAGLLAVLVGIALTRSVTDRVGGLARGTEALAKGELGTRLEPSGKDELADLAGSFNAMAEELQQASARIHAQKDELEHWNRELEARVAEKTRELKAAQELLLRSRALAAIGTMGAGVAHEINNPLTSVLGAAQLLLADAPAGSPLRPLLVDIEEQAQRIRGIVAELLAMSPRESGGERVAIGVPQVVDAALAQIGEEALREAGISVERRFDEVPAVRADPDLLRAAIVELLTNARRAMPTGGTLSLSATAPDPRLVVVRIADSGHGIPSELLLRIFDPFFTTKSEWGAPGLGLTRVHRIIEAHRGTIAVDSQAGRGATFTITLPADGGRGPMA